jgi:Zn-dependent peptidase ImmA (M78 family)
MAGGDRRWSRRLEAADAALDLLSEVGSDQGRQIDVFDLCEQVGLWLAFAPLDNLLGAYVPQGSGGILITTRRPLTVQRYTAAHELGHWRLRHGAVADTHDQVFRPASMEQERLAQIFAGSLLMPAPLVMAILTRVRSPADAPITPVHCYAIAREAGVSYEAAVRQLLNLNQLQRHEVDELLRARPLAIKTQLGYGQRPVNGWADVWPVDEGWHDQILSLRLDDEVSIALPENRTSGHRWMLTDDPPLARPEPEPAPLEAQGHRVSVSGQAAFAAALDAQRGARLRAPRAIVERLRAQARRPIARPDPTTALSGVDVVHDQYLAARLPGATPRQASASRLAIARPGDSTDDPPDDTDRLTAGGTGRRVLGVRFGDPGVHSVRLEYRSPYTDEPPLEQYTLHALVETRRQAISILQVAPDDEDGSWIAEVQERQMRELPPPLDPTDPALAE